MINHLNKKFFKAFSIWSKCGNNFEKLNYPIPVLKIMTISFNLAVMLGMFFVMSKEILKICVRENGQLKNED